MKGQRSYKTNLQIQLALLFLLVAILLFILLNGLQNQRKQEHLQRISERYQLACNTVCGQYRQLAIVLYSGIINRYDVIASYQWLRTADTEEKNRLRQAMYARIKPRYEELLKDGKLRHLHFHLENNRSFLRLHRPGIFGDDLNTIRPMVNSVNTAHRPIDGFEVGHIYGGYRCVFPLTGDNHTHLGSMEISFGPEALTSSLMEQYVVLSNFFIKKSVVDEKILPEEREKNYQPSPHSAYLFDRQVIKALENTSRKDLQELQPSAKIRAQIDRIVESGQTRSLYDTTIDAVITAIPIHNPVTGELNAFLTIRSRPEVFQLEKQHFLSAYCLLLLLLTSLLAFCYQQHSKKKILEDSANTLKKQRQQLMEAQQIANLGHWELDLISGHLHWSQQIFRIFALAPEDFGASVEAFLELVHPEDRDAVSRSFQQSIDQGQPFDIEHRILIRDNTVKWVRGKGVCHYDDNGIPIQCLGTVQDISRHKELEEQLYRSLNERDAITATVNDVMYMFDRQGKMKWWNRSLERISGLSTEQVGAANALDFFVQEDQNKARQAIAQVFTKGKITIEARLQTVDGVHPFEIHIVRLELQGTLYLVGSARDLTAQKEAERQISANALYLESILQSSTETAIIATTPDFRIQYFNPEAERIFATDKKSVLGKTIWEIRPEKETDGQKQERFEQVIKEVRQSGSARFPIQANDLIVDVRISNIRDSQGTFAGFLLMANDVTEQKKAEQQLLAAKEAAESANRAKSIFLSNMSHELRTPLNAILGYSQLYVEDLSLPKKFQNGVETIHKAGNHLLFLINDILDLSKVEAGKMELVPVEIPFSLFLQGVVHLIQVKAEHKHLNFFFEQGPSLPSIILADEFRLRQILLNLLSNAVKFTSKGYCTLFVHSRMVDSNTARLSFSIEDSGVGISPQMQETVFQPFQQTGDRLQYAEGSGLGLAISRKLVQLMGGELQLTSPINENIETADGAGSRFSFAIEVPVIHKGKVKGKERSPLITGYTTDDGLRRTILIVDDNASNRAVLRDTLEPLGFTLYEATDGSEVKAACKRYHPDAILMDLRMPVMDGFMITKQLKDSLKFSQIPVIAVTASAAAESELRQRCQEFGFSRYINKPYTVSELLEPLAELLNLQLNYTKENHETKETEKDILVPSKEILDELIGYAQSGNIDGVVTLAKKISALESGKYFDFAEIIQQFANNVQLMAIEQFIAELDKK